MLELDTITVQFLLLAVVAVSSVRKCLLGIYDLTRFLTNVVKKEFLGHKLSQGVISVKLFIRDVLKFLPQISSQDLEFQFPGLVLTRGTDALGILSHASFYF